MLHIFLVILKIIGIILAILFSVVRKSLSIWMILVIALGVVDIIFGFYRKTKM